MTYAFKSIDTNLGDCSITCGMKLSDQILELVSIAKLRLDWLNIIAKIPFYNVSQVTHTDV